MIRQCHASVARGRSNRTGDGILVEPCPCHAVTSTNGLHPRDRGHRYRPRASACHTARNGTCVVIHEITAPKPLVGRGEYAPRLSPASTFKISHALVALETGVVAVDSVERWDGVRHEQQPEWNRDHTVISALRPSVLWFFQRIAPRIGADRMAEWLGRFEYGNRNVSGPITEYWINGRLQISPQEQVQFLRRFYREDFPIATRHLQAVREGLEQTPGTVQNALGIQKVKALPAAERHPIPISRACRLTEYESTRRRQPSRALKQSPQRASARKSIETITSAPAPEWCSPFAYRRAPARHGQLLAAIHDVDPGSTRGPRPIRRDDSADDAEHLRSRAVRIAEPNHLPMAYPARIHAHDQRPTRDLAAWQGEVVYQGVARGIVVSDRTTLRGLTQFAGLSDLEAVQMAECKGHRVRR